MNESTANAFTALGLQELIASAATALGYEEPTAIQREAIPHLLDGRDVLGQAATGTGKTAAFALPLLQRISEPQTEGKRVRALILVPTRELAMQVAEAVHKYGRLLHVNVLPIYGGQSISVQLRALRRGVDVVVATPGRALDHIRRGTLALDSVEYLVLDEADEMLDMGFAEDLEAIAAALPRERQTALFSATLAPRVKAISKRYLREPVNVHIESERTAGGSKPRVREVAYLVQRPYKSTALARLLDMESPTSAIVFCRTRTEVDELTETLGARGYQAEALHGGLSQEQRDRVLRRFREGTSDILVATDVAARGLDIEHVSHVFNYDVPSSIDAYVHRIGRTGRAGREGIAITLAEPREHRLVRNIEQQTKRKIRIETVPTITDLRERKLALVRAAVEDAIRDGDLDSYHTLVELLSIEHDIVDVAAAALRIADSGRDGEREEIEIPAAAEEKPGGKRRAPRVQRPSEDMAKIYIGLGRSSGIRPADIVGAIANEAGISSKQIGAIDIADRFSLIEVPTDEITAIVKRLRNTTIRGKKIGARRDRRG
ncbi:MAG: DEAD/DEAH box helicase [Candidatus Eremiobacteraeota bacterium]|nr:DEAD/DEAH box helicase [Candidatus Eremiobacteraeota bacterium]